jgi:hypothetical protein
METRYNLRFTGQLKASVTPQQAIAEVASVFKLSPEAVSELILGGKPRVIRRDVDRQTADRLADVLGKAGLEVRIMPIQEQTTEPTADSISMSEPVSESLPVQGQAPARVHASGQTSSKSAGERCPRCGSSRVEAGSCLVCGVSLDQFRIHQAVSSGLSSVVDAQPAGRSEPINGDAGSRSPSLGRRDRALKHAMANPRRRGGRVPVYALGAGVLGVGLVALMVALQPESPPPSAADAVDGALLSGSAPNGSLTSTARAGSVAEQAVPTGLPTASAAAALSQARLGTAQAELPGTQPSVPSDQMPGLLKALQDAQAKAAAASPQPASSEPLDELPPDIRALYEAQQSRQSLGKALQAFQGKGAESGSP